MIQEDKYLNQCLQFCAIYNLLVCSQQLALIPINNNIKKHDKQSTNKNKTSKKFQTISKKNQPSSKKKSKFQTVTNNKTKIKDNFKIQTNQNYQENCLQSQRQSGQHDTSKGKLNQSKEFYEPQKNYQPIQFSLNSLLSQLATTSSLKKDSKDPINLWNNAKFQQQQKSKPFSYKQPQTNNNFYNNKTPERNGSNYNNNYHNPYYQKEDNQNFNYNSNYNNNNKYAYNEKPIQQINVQHVPQSKYGNQFRTPHSFEYQFNGIYNMPNQSQKNILPVVNQNPYQNQYCQYNQNPSVINLLANRIQTNMFNKQEEQPFKNSIMYSPVSRSQSPLNNSFSCRQFNQSPRQLSINRKGVQKSKSKKKMKKGQRQFYQPKSARRIAIEQENNQKQEQSNGQLEQQREMSVNVNLRTPELQGKCRQQRITDQTQITDFRNYNKERVQSKTSRMQDKKTKVIPKRLIQLDDGLSESISVLTQSRKVQKPIKINIQNKH